jgi:nucleoside-diphosphate-sugar epimerase
MILVTGSSGFIGSHLVEKIPDSFGLDKLDRGQKERFVLTYSIVKNFFGS